MSITLTMSSVVEVIVAAALASLGGVVAAVLFVRIYGLRSLAKMAPHDFVVTVALGSVLAATAARSVPLPTGVLALGGLLTVQAALSRIRRAGARTVIDNPPALLMVGETVLWESLDEHDVTPDDLRAKLREANVLRLDEVRAVVMEGTGDISVLHGDDVPLDPVLLDGVGGVDGVDAPPTWQPAQRGHDPFGR